MKLNEIIKILAGEFGTSDLKEINKKFKENSELKFRMTGEALGHFGFTGQIKSLSEEGFKVFTANKVSLIRLSDIETFGKPNSRTERIARKGTEKKVVAPKTATASKVVNPDKPVKAKKLATKPDKKFFEDNDSDEGFTAKKKRNSKAAHVGQRGSKFIPTKK